MTDLVLVVATCAFIALCVAYIGWCDRIIGPDEPDLTEHDDIEPARSDSDLEAVTP